MTLVLLMRNLNMALDHFATCHYCFNKGYEKIFFLLWVIEYNLDFCQNNKNLSILEMSNFKK